MEKRVRDEIERAQAASGDHLERVRQALWPDGRPQERVLGPLAPFLINYGPSFVPWLVDAIDLDTDGVQALYLSQMHGPA